jgi:hypothetical protein
MIAKRYVQLSLIPLLMLVLGFAAIGAPDPFRGPVIFEQASGASLGLALFTRSLYLADAIGLVLLAFATLEVWVIAIAWEYRRRKV